MKDRQVRDPAVEFKVRGPGCAKTRGRATNHPPLLSPSRLPAPPLPLSSHARLRQPPSPSARLPSEPGPRVDAQGPVLARETPRAPPLKSVAKAEKRGGRERREREGESAEKASRQAKSQRSRPPAPAFRATARRAQALSFRTSTGLQRARLRDRRTVTPRARAVFARRRVTSAGATRAPLPRRASAPYPPPPRLMIAGSSPALPSPCVWLTPLLTPITPPPQQYKTDRD